MHLVAAPSRIATVPMNPKNTREALNKHVDNEDKTTVAICDTGFNFKSRAIFINESSLIFDDWTISRLDDRRAEAALR